MTLKIHGQTELATNPTPDAAEVPVFYQGEVKKVTVENLRIQPVRLVYTVGSYDFNPNTYITAGYLFCEIDLLGPGGGGGAGRKGASGTARYGGDGGGGGGKSNNRFLLSQLATAYPAFSLVAVGGVGGAQQTVDDSDGQDGSASADLVTSFYYGTAFCVMAYGGNGGAGGSSTPSTAQALGGGGSVEGMCGGAARLFDYSGGVESISYRYLDTDTPPGTLVKMSVTGYEHNYGVFAGGGGGAGGGVDTSDVPYPGAQGGKAETSFEVGSRAQGGAISTGGQSPSNFGFQTSVAAGGGGGGGADLVFGGGGGYGDNGGDTTHSGGGGGGGAAENGIGHAGSGGNGANGLAIITIY